MIIPIGARILKIEPCNDRFFDNVTSGYRFLTERGIIEIYPASGGYVHGGEFDPWDNPDCLRAGATLWKIEQEDGTTFDERGDFFEWTSVCIHTSLGSCRAMVRDHGDPYDYGAGLVVNLQLTNERRLA